jgi:hypothetical protein
VTRRWLIVVAVTLGVGVLAPSLATAESSGAVNISVNPEPNSEPTAGQPVSIMVSGTSSQAGELAVYMFEGSSPCPSVQHKEEVVVSALAPPTSVPAGRYLAARAARRRRLDDEPRGRHLSRALARRAAPAHGGSRRAIRAGCAWREVLVQPSRSGCLAAGRWRALPPPRGGLRCFQAASIPTETCGFAGHLSPCLALPVWGL